MKSHDNTHSIYRREAFGTEEYEIEQAEGIPLFTGALVCVDGMNPVSFVSENAQTQDLEDRTPNPVTETVEVNGTMTAGTDFPAGTYDIEAAGEDFGYITYEVPYEDPYSEGEQSYYSFGVMMEKNPTSEYPAYCSVYKNVVLQRGQLWIPKVIYAGWYPATVSFRRIMTDFITTCIKTGAEHEQR